MSSSRLSQPSLSARRIAALLVLALAATSPGRLVAIDGDLDLTFGNGAGVRIVNFDLGGGLDDSCAGIAAAADGILFAVGYSESEFVDLDWTVARITEGVAPLKTRLYFDLGGSHDDRALAVALDRSGRLLVAGDAANSDRTELRVCRLLPAALALDPTFNSGGCAAYNLGPQTVFTPSAVAEAPDMGVLVAGTLATFGPDFEWFVLKFTSAGAIDTSFGTSGVSVISWNLVPSGFDHLLGMAVDPLDGSIALVGTAQTALRVGALARLTAAGSLDLGFGQQGKTTWSIVLGGDPKGTVGTAVVREPVGNAYQVSAYFENVAGVSNTLLVSRFDSSGVYSGSVPEGWGDAADYPTGLLLQSDRKLVVTGDAASGTLFRAGRFLSNGAGAAPDHDPGYAAGGEAILDPDFTFGIPGAGVCAATLDGGRVVLLADGLRPDRDWLVIRLQNSSIFLDGFEPGNALQWSAVTP